MGDAPNTYRRDEPGQLRELAGIDPPARVIFALLCAARLLPQFRRFAEATGQSGWETLEEHAARLWRHVSDDSLSRSQLESAIKALSAVTPSEDDEGWDPAVHPYAEDAASALVYAYRTALRGEAQEAVWASRMPYDSVDHFVGRIIGGDAFDEEAQRGHPLVQAELQRQARDLKELAALGPGARRAAERLRLRAEREATELFGLG